MKFVRSICIDRRIGGYIGKKIELIRLIQILVDYYSRYSFDQACLSFPFFFLVFVITQSYLLEIERKSTRKKERKKKERMRKIDIAQSSKKRNEKRKKIVDR